MEYDDVIRIGSKVAYKVKTLLSGVVRERHGTVTAFVRNGVTIRPDTRTITNNTRMVERQTHLVRKLRIEELI